MSELSPAFRRKLSPWRLIGWGVIAALLSLPAILRFPWTAFDFILRSVLLGSVGLGIEFFVRRSGSTFARLGAAVAVIGAFLTIWVNLAVGMIGAQDNPYNLLFIGLLVAVALGGFAVRLKPSAMVWLLSSAALLHRAIALGGLSADPGGAPFAAFFAIFWLLGAALYRGAAVGEREATR